MLSVHALATRLPCRYAPRNDISFSNNLYSAPAIFILYNYVIASDSVAISSHA
jgi:hypothetical protein